MRIVHLVIGGEVAGGQLVALRLARAARKRGDEVSFVAPEEGAFVGLARADGFPVAVVRPGGALDPRAHLRLLRTLRRLRPGIVHSHTHFAGNVLSRVAGRLAGATVVSHAHIAPHYRAGRGASLQRALENLTAGLCSRVIAVSDDTRRAFERDGLPSRLLVTVRNGIEPWAAPGRRDATRRELGIPDGARALGVVARLCDVKGQRELVAALAGLDDDAIAVLVGADLEQGGAYEELLRSEARRLGVEERVLFAGYRADVPAVLEALDIFVLPSWIEGLPLVVLEAMAAGLPVVATAVGGTPELVADGETGLLVPARDVEALRGALAALLADPERARRLGEAGRRRVETSFSAAEASARVLAVYDEAAGCSATTSSS